MSTRRPVILVASSTGLTASGDAEARLLMDYAVSVARAGGAPLVVPPLPDGPAWRRLVSVGDGVLVTGGPDINPARYGRRKHPKTNLLPPEREEADFRLVAWADRRRRLPVMGICLGAQVLAVHRGGTLIQDIPDERPDALEHRRLAPKGPRPRHTVRIDPASRLARIVGRAPLSANTSHHQGIDQPGRRLRPVAWSSDGIIEALEDGRPDRFYLAIQWHPEELWREKRHLALFRALVRAAARRK